MELVSNYDLPVFSLGYEVRPTAVMAGCNVPMCTLNFPTDSVAGWDIWHYRHARVCTFRSAILLLPFSYNPKYLIQQS